MRPFVLVAIAILSGPPLAAQREDAALTVQRGGRAIVVARLVEGRWVAAAPCVAPHPPGPAQPGERLGATGLASVRPARRVGPGTGEWLRLAPAILRLFEEREREQQLTERHTEAAPRAIDWIFSVESDAGRTYYFEASRRVPSGSADVDDDTDPPGTLRVAVAGFLRERDGGTVSLGTKSELRWEQDGLPLGPSRPDLTPLGLVRYGDRSAWVMHGQSGQSGWFALYDVGSNGIRTLVTARAC